MKKLIIFVSVVLSLTSVKAQTPQAFKYQAVVRDNTGNVLVNQSVAIKISILKGSTSGSVVYSETHKPTTNGFGLVNLEIGNGSLVSGNFVNIDWGNDDYFIKIEMDASGGTNYLAMGTTQLLAVPYALYAENVANVNDADADTTNEIQILSIYHDTMHITQGNFIRLDFDRNDRDSTNELQAISISNDTIFLENGGFVKLPQGHINDADGDSTNEIQAISISNDTIFLSGGGFVKLPSNYGGFGNTGISGDCGSIFMKGVYVRNLIDYYSDAGSSKFDSLARGPIPENGYITNLHVYPASIPDSGGSMTATLMKNGVPTSLSVSHSSFDGMIIKFDTITRVNLNRSDLFSIKIAAGTIAPNAHYKFSYVFKCYNGHYVGELYGGGILFWVTPDRQHGLIASLNDLDGGSGVAWSDSSNSLIGAPAQSMTNGASNTAAIVTQNSKAGYAATLCDSYTGGGFSDWYLPSQRELYLLVSQDVVIDYILDNDSDSTTNGFEQNHGPSLWRCYWSSTEHYKNSSISYSFYYSATLWDQKSQSNRVRAIRAF